MRPRGASERSVLEVANDKSPQLFYAGQIGFKVYGSQVWWDTPLSQHSGRRGRKISLRA